MARAEHQTFTGLVVQVRRNRAERGLSSGLTMTEIADRLGFTEVSSFSRWFVGEYGVPGGGAAGGGGRRAHAVRM